MVKQLKKPNNKPKATYSIAEAYGYTHKDFKKWGKLGGRPAKYVNDSERQKAYRRRKAKAKLLSGERIGILNMTTGRINKYRTKAEKQRAYRLRKKEKFVGTIINKLKKRKITWQVLITPN